MSNVAQAFAGQFSGSVNSKILWGNYQYAAAAAYVPFTSTLTPDPNSPYFRIFAGQLGDPAATWVTKVTFSLGGTICGNPLFFTWGNSGYYETGAGPNVVSGLVFTPILGDDALVVTSQYAGASGTQGYIGNNGTATSVQNGFITKWTALADTVTLTSTPYKAGGVTPNQVEAFHGVIQGAF